MLKKPLAALVLLVLMLSAIASGSGTSGMSVTDYVCDPTYTNHIFSNFSNPIIYPGNTGNLRFRLNNPYNMTMHNISLTAEIYAFATLEEYRTIDETFNDAPIIEQSGSRLYNDRVSELLPSMNISYSLSMKTEKGTPQGVYYVRFILEFDYSNSTNNSASHFIMLSMSYYSKEQWKYAAQEPTDSDMPYYRHGINVTYLSLFHPVDAIIPFTSFSVHKGIPKWPMFVLEGAAAFFAVLSYMYYMNDNYGKYRWLDEKTKQMSGKYQKFRRRLYERARQK